MMYAIFHCRDTLEVLAAAPYAYAPLERYQTLLKRETRVRPIMPRFVFVPVARVPEFRRAMPERFNIQQLTTGAGLPHYTTKDVLYEMQRRINEETLPKKPKRFEKGERVVILSGPFAGVEGVIVRLKADDNYRIMTDSKLGYININARALARKK